MIGLFKRRIEFIFLIVLIICTYYILFTSIPDLWKFILLGVYSGIIFVTIYSLVLENRSANHTILWMFSLVFFPIAGYFFYLYSGQLYLKGYLFRSKRQKDKNVWERLMREQREPDLTFLQENQHTFLQFAKNASSTPVSTASRTLILKDGDQTFSEIKQKLRNATKFIHLEYYVFRTDRIGREIIEILIEKAQAGVEVLFIYDAAGSIHFSEKLLERMHASGIKVHPFSPLKYGFFNQKLNFRNHRKIMIVDGEVGFVGGLNIGDEYLGEDDKLGYWRDTHMILRGEAVYTLHTVFLLDWEYVSGDKVLENHAAVKPELEEEDLELDGAVQVVVSGPDTQQGIMGDYYYALIASAERSIWIATPYFVPDEAIRKALKVAAAKGLDVKIMVPEVNDSFLTQYASKSYFPELLRNGVEIYSYKKGFLHQKVIIVDGNMASIGTANIDMRSFHLNFEVNVFLLGTSSIRDLAAHYETDMNDSEKIRPVKYYKRGFIDRSKESFARLFSGVL